MKNKTKHRIAILAMAVLMCAGSLSAHAYDYGFVLSCGMDFTYHSPTELTEQQRREILMKLDKMFCDEENEEEGGD